ncbi:MAG TPA: P-loop NTPase fold protein [Gaiellaceae bacterium]|nr:P-loop NTPase fold protein [Gaiellaceae bacterium]
MYRGVGKTSLVYRALHDVSTAPAETNVLLVLLNAAQLEAERDDHHQIIPRQILVNLIRRLYTASLDADLADELTIAIDALYRKAVAVDYAERYQSTAAASVQVRRESEIAVRADVSLPTWFTWAASYALAAFLLALPSVGSHLPARVAALLLAAPIPFAAQAIVRWRRSRTSETNLRDEAKTLYAFDASIGNLEFDLESVHRDLAGVGVTSIYVIDELDKLEADQVVDVLKYFKSLFTLSAAIFVFVGGEELARRFGASVSNEEDIYRPKEYTYFTTQYFLARPDSNDLRSFLDEVFDEDSDAPPDLVERLRDLLIFEAAGDFFDLRRAVRDRITGFDGDVPLIQLDDPTEEEKLLMNLQRALDVVFDGKYRVFRPSRWPENEAVRRELYRVAAQLARGYVGMTVEDDEADTLTAAAARDYRTLLHRPGALSIIESRDKEIRGRTITLHAYGFTGGVSEAIPTTLGFLSESESALVEAFRGLAERVLEINNVDRVFRRRRRLPRAGSSRSIGLRTRQLTGWGFDLESLTAEARDVFGGLTESTPPRAYRREDIERLTREVEAARVRLDESAPMLVANIIAALHTDLSAKPLRTPGVAFGVGQLQEFGRTVDRDLAWLVIDAEADKELLVTSPVANAVVKRYASALRGGASVYRVLAIGQSEDAIRPKPKGFRAISWTPEERSANDRALGSVVSWLLS